ncbi:MAG: hypothetical protein ACFFDI_30680, partial [Promethearchaeota archaeon]
MGFHFERMTGVFFLISLSLSILSAADTEQGSVVVFSQRIIVEPGDNAIFNFTTSANFSAFSIKVALYSNADSSAKFSMALKRGMHTIWKSTELNIRGVSSSSSSNRNLPARAYSFLVHKVLVSQVDFSVEIVFGTSYAEINEIHHEWIDLNYLDPVPLVFVLIIIMFYSLANLYLFKRMNTAFLINYKEPSDRFVKFSSIFLYWLTFGLILICCSSLSDQINLISPALAFLASFFMPLLWSVPAMICAFYSGYWSRNSDIKVLLGIITGTISIYWGMLIFFSYLNISDPNVQSLAGLAIFLLSVIFFLPTIALSWLMGVTFSH